ncbi:protein MGARP-like isoform X2 [Polyodon spathula]|uniref:protein MGARP-like isoform X2 n=1 Tax=Polyodon spathula TaxID=7913 RepID=UPI001B7E37FF|nr:protein MGARP-like isoform X2 [Polyodon spathula]
MYLCRAVWQKLAPVARTSTRFARNAPVRQMSSSGAPGSTGDNLVYVILCGGSFAGAGYYVYKTLTTDSARYRDRVTEISSRPKSEWTPKPWPSNKEDESEDSGEEEAAPEPLAESAEALEEALAEASAESPSPALFTEAGVADAPAAEEEISSLVENSQEPAPTDAAPVQETEPVAEMGGLAAASVETEVSEAVAELPEAASAVAIEVVSPVVEKPEKIAEAPVEVETSTPEDVPASQAAEEEAIQNVKVPEAEAEPVEAASPVVVEVVAPVVQVCPVAEEPVETAEAPVVTRTPPTQEVQTSQGSTLEASQEVKVGVTESVEVVEVASPVAEASPAVESDSPVVAETLSAEVPVSPRAAEEVVHQVEEILAEVTATAAAGSEEATPEGPSEGAQVPHSEEDSTVQQQEPALVDAIEEVAADSECQD